MKLRHLAIGYVVVDSTLILKTLFSTFQSPPMPSRVLVPLLLFSLTLSTTTNIFLLKGKRWARKLALTVNLVAFPFAVFGFLKGYQSALIFISQVVQLLLILAIHLISRAKSEQIPIVYNDPQ